MVIVEANDRYPNGRRALVNGFDIRWATPCAASDVLYGRVAVSSVKIDGVAHEFSSIPDVMEDVMEIILNIKKLKFSCDVQLPRTLELYADRAGAVTGADIRDEGVAVVLNPEQLICTLDKNRPLRMELEIDRGRGYRPSEDNKRDDQPIGTIPVDCLFSPIERVRYDVQACRVGQHTEYDRLELEVWTDGRIKPKEAVHRAPFLCASIWLCSWLATCRSVTRPTAVLNEEERTHLRNCSERQRTGCQSCYQLLASAQIIYIGQLVEKSESQMLKYRNFGKKSLAEIKQKLADLELRLKWSRPMP